MKPETHDYAYIIVRSLKNSLTEYHNFLGISSKTKTTFDTWYTPAFLQQIANDNNAKEILRDLIHMDRQGKDIVLACFCSNPSLCHRSITASILAENGATVLSDGPIKNYGLLL